MEKEENVGPDSDGAHLDVGLLVRALEKIVDAVEIDDMAGNIVYVSDAWCRLFERDQREVVGRRWDSVHPYPPQSDRGLRALWRKAVREGRSQGIFYLTGSDGCHRRVYYARTLYRNADGAASVIVTIYKPLDKTASDYLNAVLEEQDDGIAVLDADGRIVTTNQTFYDLVCRQGQELDGIDIRSLIPGIGEVLPPDSDVTPLDSALAKGAWSGSLDVIRNNGGYAPVRLSVSAAGDDLGNTIGFVLRANPPLMYQLEAEDKVQQIKHELRNVFTAILGSTELMLNGHIEDEATRQRLNYIMMAADSGMERLEDM